MTEFNSYVLTMNFMLASLCALLVLVLWIFCGIINALILYIIFKNKNSYVFCCFFLEYAKYKYVYKPHKNSQLKPNKT